MKARTCEADGCPDEATHYAESGDRVYETCRRCAEEMQALHGHAIEPIAPEPNDDGGDRR